ncbi:MAG: YdiU family protein [Myxococcaceae bacterium]|nr:YdiU family protein [Myxococcaceae bacterium]
MTFTFDNTYERLPDRLYARVVPSKVSRPRVVKVNRRLAETLGLDAGALASAEGTAVLSGNTVPSGAASIALAYAGHQFGHFVPQLGDGRAILLGELVGIDGKRRDVQLKGAGRTPFSRGGDGRAALGPVLREYVLSEAMFALGVPTTRALAAVVTGDRVERDEVLPGAIFTRVAASHLRVGTFEYFAARGDRAALAALTTYALERHYPDASGTGNDALALLERVIAAHAGLVAQWLGVGFIHGVMNTDNTSISGETLDYGPCAFLDEYDHRKTFSSIDVRGRYAFGNQPGIAQWNLAKLAEALLPLIDADEEEAVRIASDRISRFPGLFEAAYGTVMRAKLGFSEAHEQDVGLVAELLESMQENRVDFTLLFRGLCELAQGTASDASVAALFADPTALYGWAGRWRDRLALEKLAPVERATAMRRVNPAFIPRNHRLEELITAAVTREDFGPFETLVKALERPYEAQPEVAHLAEPPKLEERVSATFCGT